MFSFLILLGVLLVGIHGCFLGALLKQRNDIADVAWGLGFVTLAWVSFLLFPPHSMKAMLVNTLITIWGVRLSIHVLLRNRKKLEDYRYRQLRIAWGKKAVINSYFKVFLLQGFLVGIIFCPILIINIYHASLTIIDLMAAIIWTIGFSFETIADFQLTQHINSKAHKELMTSGLWRYSRHPNYFGEVTLWWGIFLFAVSLPWGWGSIVSPLTITILILYISGIPLLEEKLRKRAGFAEYCARTNKFFPWLPRPSK